MTGGKTPSLSDNHIVTSFQIRHNGNHMNDDVAEVNGSSPQIYQALSSTRKSQGTRLYKHGTNKMYRLSKKTGAWKYKKDPSHCWCVSTAPTQSNTEHWHLLLWHHVRNTPRSMHYSGTTICTKNEQRSYLCTVRWKPQGFNWVIFDHWGIIYLSMSYNYLAEIKQYSGTQLLR